jgi:hypothetical protein
MGGCLATIFKGKQRHVYRPIRTGTTAKYGTNSRDQSYIGRGFSGASESGNSRVAGSGSSSLTCPACGYTTQFKRDMHQHIANRHGGKVKRPKKTRSDPATDYVPGGTSGEAAASSKWNDLHKSESELAAEIILRDHAVSSGQYANTEKKPSRFSRAKKGASGLYSSARSAISQHGITSGTRGVAKASRKKKKKKKRVK